jgi:hypothetical protein
MDTTRKNPTLLVLILLSPLLLAWLVMYLLFLFLVGIFLTLAVWLWWCPRGRCVLLVYSDSPIWKERIEETLLPKLAPSAVIINWSHRKSWRWHALSTLLFHYFGGDKEFNPMAVIFHPGKFPKTFRFWKGYQVYKKGNAEPLEKEIGKMFDYLTSGTTG